MVVCDVYSYISTYIHTQFFVHSYVLCIIQMVAQNRKGNLGIITCDVYFYFSCMMIYFLTIVR